MQYGCMLAATYFLILGNKPVFIGLALLSYLWMVVFGKNIGIPEEEFKKALETRPKIVGILYSFTAFVLIFSLIKDRMNVELPIPLSTLQAFLAFVLINIVSDSYLLKHYMSYSKKLQKKNI